MPARADLRLAHAFALLLGFAVTALPAFWFPVAVGFAGLVVALMGSWQLFRNASPRFSAFAAGSCAALGSSLFAGQGAPFVASTLIGFAVVSLAFQLARRRPGFASTRLREEALSAASLAALALASVPTVAAGWQSALTLNRSDEPAGPASMSAWVWVFIAVATLLGVTRSLWTRR
jgi:hypothetical protein